MTFTERFCFVFLGFVNSIREEWNENIVMKGNSFTLGAIRGLRDGGNDFEDLQTMNWS